MKKIQKLTWHISNFLSSGLFIIIGGISVSLWYTITYPINEEQYRSVDVPDTFKLLLTVSNDEDRRDAIIRVIKYDQVNVLVKSGVEFTFLLPGAQETH